MTPSAAVDRVLRRLLPLARDRVVCTVAGESGVGKTTLARDCASALQDRGIGALVVHQDHYFHLPPRANHRRRLEDLGRVGPDEVDWSHLQSHTSAFLAGSTTLSLPTVDEPADRFDVVPRDIANVRVLLVEGTYVTVLPDVDLRVFVRGSAESTLAARRGRGRDPIEAITDRILAREHAMIAPHEAKADLVLDQLSPP